MTPEERERYDRIDHTLESLAARDAEHDARLDRLEGTIEAQGARIEAHSAQIAAHSTQIGELRAEISELGRYVLQLARIVESTNDRINAVIAVVERHFGNGRDR